MSSNIPQLNEDIYEKILKVIIHYKQADLLELKAEYAGLNLPMIKSEKNHVKWPKLLQSSSQRLVYHDYVPLLKDAILCVPEVCDAKHLVREHCDTLKHVGQVSIYNTDVLNGAFKPKQIEHIDGCICAKCKAPRREQFFFFDDSDDDSYNEVYFWFHRRESDDADYVDDYADYGDAADVDVSLDEIGDEYDFNDIEDQYVNDDNNGGVFEEENDLVEDAEQGDAIGEADNGDVGEMDDNSGHDDYEDQA